MQNTKSHTILSHKKEERKKKTFMKYRNIQQFFFFCDALMISI
jgi:hypothetical protein